MAVKPRNTTQMCGCSQARVRVARAAGSVNSLSLGADYSSNRLDAPFGHVGIFQIVLMTEVA
jgi:hypothetical protein